METSTINRIDIYYFTGTGNALCVAKWIKEVAEQNQIEVTLWDISKLSTRKEIKVPENSMVGIISPTHGFNFPPVMFHFLLRFPKANRNNIFIINTRAGMKMGKIFLPGLSGMAQYFSALLLSLKRYKVNGMFPVDLPSNWISLHPGIKQNVVDSIFEKRKKQTEEFTKQIISGKKNLKALWDIIQDLLITPIAFLYYLIGRFVLAKTFIASKKCNNCNLCVKECPIQAIKLVDNRPFWTFNCESCMHCMNKCPQRAIETAHGYIIALLILINAVVIRQFYKLTDIDTFISEMPFILEKTVGTIINSIFLIAGTFVTYRLLHYMLKFSFFEKLIVYTSLTKYKFWRRYKSPKLKSTNK